MKNITGYLKNHWTKRRLACTYSDSFLMLISNLDIIFYNSEFFKYFLRMNENDGLHQLDNCKEKVTQHLCPGMTK